MFPEVLISIFQQFIQIDGDREKVTEHDRDTDRHSPRPYEKKDNDNDKRTHNSPEKQIP
jgi:hypothetical protein